MPKILILAANPKDTSRLRLDQELRDIEEGLRRAKHRSEFTFTQRLAVRSRDIQRAMLEETPQIVHFSGHGDGAEGLVFENEIGQSQRVSGAALARLFAIFTDPTEFPNPVHCVVLNGCYSAIQAEAIAKYVPYVVGMTQAMGDRAAIDFAVGFYDALGAGRNVEFAYKLGCAAIDLANEPESATPVLINKKTPLSVAQLLPPLVSTPSIMSIPLRRADLYQFLLKLPDTQFNQVLVELNPPSGNISPRHAPRGQRVAELFDWLETIGPGTEALRATLNHVANQARNSTSIANEENESDEAKDRPEDLISKRSPPSGTLHNLKEYVKTQASRNFKLAMTTTLVVAILIPVGLTTYSHTRSRKLINVVKEFYSRREYEECISTAARKLEVERSHQVSSAIEYFQDRCRIGLAREIVNTTREYEGAIEVLQDITRNRELHEEAEELIENYFLLFEDS